MGTAYADKFTFRGEFDISDYMALDGLTSKTVAEKTDITREKLFELEAEDFDANVVRQYEKDMKKA